MAQSFLARLLAMLERKRNLERYAWFADRVANEYGLGSIFNPDSAGITAMGEIYRNGG